MFAQDRRFHVHPARRLFPRHSASVRRPCPQTHTPLPPRHPPGVSILHSGIVGKVTETTVEVISEDADEAGSLRPPLRLDVVASEATHKKLMLVRGRIGSNAGVPLSMLLIWFESYSGTKDIWGRVGRVDQYHGRPKRPVRPSTVHRIPATLSGTDQCGCSALDKAGEAVGILIGSS